MSEEYKTTLSISLDIENLKKVDKEKKENGGSRSSIIDKIIEKHYKNSENIKFKKSA